MKKKNQGIYLNTLQVGDKFHLLLENQLWFTGVVTSLGSGSIGVQVRYHGSDPYIPVMETTRWAPSTIVLLGHPDNIHAARKEPKKEAKLPKKAPPLPVFEGAIQVKFPYAAAEAIDLEDNQKWPETQMTTTRKGRGYTAHVNTTAEEAQRMLLELIDHSNDEKTNPAVVLACKRAADRLVEVA